MSGCPGRPGSAPTSSPRRAHRGCGPSCPAGTVHDRGVPGVGVGVGAPRQTHVLAHAHARTRGPGHRGSIPWQHCLCPSPFRAPQHWPLPQPRGPAKTLRALPSGGSPPADGDPWPQPASHSQLELRQDRPESHRSRGKGRWPRLQQGSPEYSREGPPSRVAVGGEAGHGRPHWCLGPRAPNLRPVGDARRVPSAPQARPCSRARTARGSRGRTDLITLRDSDGASSFLEN